MNKYSKNICLYTVYENGEPYDWVSSECVDYEDITPIDYGFEFCPICGRKIQYEYIDLDESDNNNCRVQSSPTHRDPFEKEIEKICKAVLAMNLKED